MPLADYMALCNAHYYATRDPLGAAGDFVTAPEISQMFGELAGLCLADMWSRAGRPAAVYVELGPGRGTLAADARRAMASAGFAPPVHLVETSPALRAAQVASIPDATFHDTIATVPVNRPLLVVANEFFDALPIRQRVRTSEGSRERTVVAREGTLRFDPASPAKKNVSEDSPAGIAIMRALAVRITRQGGAALAIDYGYEGPASGDTLQAVSRHRFVDPLVAPGERDLTAHVDFAALAAVARAAGCAVRGPIGQGDWLTALGIDARADRLARTTGRADEIAAARHRLVAPDAMGALFKVLAVGAPGWPVPAGFA